MADVVDLAVFFILGILQVSSQETRSIQSGNTVYEIQCFKETISLTEGNPRSLFILKDDLARKLRAISFMDKIISEESQCCGKESHENKCLGEKMLPLMQKLEEVLSTFLRIHSETVMKTIANISTLTTYAVNEIDCCCPSRELVTCVQKIEFPTSSIKATIKKCRSKTCAEGFNRLLKELVAMGPKLYVAAVVQEQMIKHYESLQKFKEEIPKDGKCQEEGRLADLRKELSDFQLITSVFLGLQVQLYFQAQHVVDYIAAASSEILECPLEKQSRYYIFV